MIRTPDLRFLSTRALLRARVRAQRAEARGRDQATALRTRIEAELERRRSRRFDRAGRAAPPIPLSGRPADPR